MQSTAISHLAYDTMKRELKVTFVTGRRYVYDNVPSDVFDMFRIAPSRGAFFNHEIRDTYDFHEIARQPAEQH